MLNRVMQLPGDAIVDRVYSRTLPPYRCKSVDDGYVLNQVPVQNLWQHLNWGVDLGCAHMRRVRK